MEVTSSRESKSVTKTAATVQAVAKGRGAAPEHQAGPRNETDAQHSFATDLLVFEAEVRNIKNKLELDAHLCNSSRKILGFRQCFYGTVKPKTTKFKLRGISSVAVIDKNVPFNRWIEKLVSRVLKENDTSRQISFTLPAYCDESDEEKSTYPFIECLWTPQIIDEQIVGGVLLTKETPWTEKEQTISARVVDLYLHAQASLKGKKALSKNRPTFKPFLFGLSILTIALGFLPVSVTALAPVEIVPKDPYVLERKAAGRSARRDRTSQVSASFAGSNCRSPCKA